VPHLDDAEILAALRADVLRGGYMLVDYRGYRSYSPGENVIHVFAMGALVPAALLASEKLLARGIYANVIVVSSPDLLIGELGRADDYAHLTQTLGIDGSLHLDAAKLGALDAVDMAGRRIPVVSVHDGELGLLDNIGSVLGVRQIPIAVRKFSKSGTPDQIYAYHGMDADHIVEACGEALAVTAQERVTLRPEAYALLQRQQSASQPQWKQLWPEPE